MAATLLMNDAPKLAAEMQYLAPCSAFGMPSHALAISQTQNRVPEVGADRWWRIQQPLAICSQKFRPVHSVEYAPEYTRWLQETGTWRESSEVHYSTVLRVSQQLPETWWSWPRGHFRYRKVPGTARETSLSEATTVAWEESSGTQNRAFIFFFS